MQCLNVTMNAVDVTVVVFIIFLTSYVYCGHLDANTHLLRTCSVQEFNVSCSKMYLKQIPDSLPIDVKNLDISINLIRDVTTELDQLANLQTLNLSQNVISSMTSSCFANKQQLRSLDLSYNQLSNDVIADAQISQLSSLKTLNLSRNNLGPEIPNFSHLDTLKILDISFNYISVLSRDSFEGCFLLEELVLKGNSLTSFEVDKISILSSLTRLDLSRNPLEIISSRRVGGGGGEKGGGGERGGERVAEALQQTSVTTDSFSSLKSLQRLRLNDCPNLRRIDLPLDVVFPQLQIFEASNCAQLSYVSDGTLGNLNNLSCVHMSNNAFVRLNYSILPWSRLLHRSVRLDGNPLHCDCAQVVLLSRPEVVRVLDVPENLTCAQPPEVKGKCLLDVTEQDLRCELIRNKHSDVIKNDTNKLKNNSLQTITSDVTTNSETKWTQNSILGVTLPVAIGIMMMVLVVCVHFKKAKVQRLSYEMWLLRSVSYGSLREQPSVESVATETGSFQTVHTRVDSK